MDTQSNQPARELTCPTCGAVVIPERTRAMPFCSPRCKLVDLGRWVNEEYGLPIESDRDAELDDWAEPLN